MLRSTGFPRRIGDRHRLDTLTAWEQTVLAGELPGCPDEPESSGAATVVPPPVIEPEPTPPADGSVAIGDDGPVAAPARRRTRGARRAA